MVVLRNAYCHQKSKAWHPMDKKSTVAFLQKSKPMRVSGVAGTFLKKLHLQCSITRDDKLAEIIKHSREVESTTNTQFYISIYPLLTVVPLYL